MITQDHSDLYIGVDVGKQKHSAFVISRALLAQHGKHYRKYPRLSFDNSREGFQQFLTLLTPFAPPECCHVLTESTGHYGLNFEQFLVEHGITRYRIQAHKRYSKDKTDILDARALAMRLYNQEALGILIADRHEQIHPVIDPIPAARSLRGSIVQTRAEMVQRRTAIFNKLTAIADELFPELSRVYDDVHSPSCLNLREAFPTPESIASAPIDALCETRKRNLPSRKQLLHLQELAATTIGTKDPYRRTGLLMEQRLLIKEVLPLSQSIDELDAKITETLAPTREGKILQSFIGIGPTHAATLLSGIGNIANFERASRLRGYLGCAPKATQTGITADSSNLDKKGTNASLRATMFLIVNVAIKYDPTWRALYDRLAARMCHYDARKKKLVGKKRVIIRLAGQMIFVIYRLLRKDYELVMNWTGTEPLPEPELYDPAKHHVMKAGGKSNHQDTATK